MNQPTGERLMEIAVKAILWLVLGVPFVVVLTAAVSIWRGFVLSVMWGWFVVPMFALPPMSIAMAIGISLTASTFTCARRWNEMDDEAKKWRPLYMTFISPAVTLGVAWIVKHYV